MVLNTRLNLLLSQPMKKISDSYQISSENSMAKTTVYKTTVQTLSEHIYIYSMTTHLHIRESLM